MQTAHGKCLGEKQKRENEQSTGTKAWALMDLEADMEEEESMDVEEVAARTSAVAVTAAAAAMPPIDNSTTNSF